MNAKNPFKKEMKTLTCKSKILAPNPNGNMSAPTADADEIFPSGLIADVDASLLDSVSFTPILVTSCIATPRSCALFAERRKGIKKY
jgi:hypothetical protein